MKEKKRKFEAKRDERDINSPVSSFHSELAGAKDRGKRCVRCGLGGQHFECDGIHAVRPCSLCIANNTICIFMPNNGNTKYRKRASKSLKVGERIINLADKNRFRTEQKTLECGKGRVPLVTSWDERKDVGDATLPHILKLWQDYCPELGNSVNALYPNDQFSHSSDEVVNQIEEEIEVDLEQGYLLLIVDPMRFALPSSEMLNSIQNFLIRVASEENRNIRQLEGKFEPELLLSLGILLQEMIREDTSPESYNTLSRDQIQRNAPNLVNLLGPEVLEDAPWLTQALAYRQFLEDHRFYSLGRRK